MADIALAVIGGTGVYRLADLQDVETRVLDTRFGAPSAICWVLPCSSRMPNCSVIRVIWVVLLAMSVR